MVKNILILGLLIAAGWWVYNNVDFAQIMPGTMNAASQEKTINKVKQNQEGRRTQLNKAIDGDY